MVFEHSSDPNSYNPQNGDSSSRIFDVPLEVWDKWLGSAGYKPKEYPIYKYYNPLILTIDPNFQQDI